MKVIQETDTLARRIVLGVGGGLLVATVVFIGISALLLQCRQAELGPRDRGARNRRPPAEIEAMELTLFDTLEGVESRQERQRELLEGYGWIDEEGGLVRIPVERAMELYLERRSKEAP